MRRNAAGVALLVAVAGGVAWWVVARPRPLYARTIPTGASFSIAVAQPRDYVRARSAAERLQQDGWPAFTRTLRSGTQVIVGPFVDIVEVDRAQRRLAARGYAARMIVDESIRRAPGFGGIPTVGNGIQVLLVAGAGRLSVVLELAEEPRTVTSDRVGPHEVVVHMGPVTRAVERQRWSTPEGVELVEDVLVEEVSAGGERLLRTRLTVSEYARSNVRLLGRRLYVDLWSDQGLETRSVAQAIRGPRGPAPQQGATDALATDAARTLVVRDNYDRAIAPATARLRSMEPFVKAALAAPSPDVLDALGTSLAALDAWILEVETPPESAAQHEALRGRVRQLRDEVSAARRRQPQ
jgi:hypothetical protein